MPPVRSRRGTKPRFSRSKKPYDKVQDRKINKLAKALKPESKFFDTDIAGTVDNTPTYTIDLLKLDQGLTPSTRVGDEIDITSMHFRFYVQAASAATTTPYTRVRILAILDKKPQLSIPQIYSATATQSVLAQASTEGQKNIIETRTRFRILKEWNFDIANSLAVNGGSAMLQGRHFNFYHKFKKPMRSRFSSGNVASGYTNLHETNVINIVGYSTSSGLGLVPVVVGFVRISYTDV